MATMRGVESEARDTALERSAGRGAKDEVRTGPVPRRDGTKVDETKAIVGGVGSVRDNGGMPGSACRAGDDQDRLDLGVQEDEGGWGETR